MYFNYYRLSYTVVKDWNCQQKKNGLVNLKDLCMKNVALNASKI